MEADGSHRAETGARRELHDWSSYDQQHVGDQYGDGEIHKQLGGARMSPQFLDQDDGQEHNDSAEDGEKGADVYELSDATRQSDDVLLHYTSSQQICLVSANHWAAETVIEQHLHDPSIVKNSAIVPCRVLGAV
jgi:hypothetical protein